ncbi:MAG TPA: histidine kinase, partial [Ferruginibacter sp.]|nr:histidine kinase [Ferruginibacter sp.]
IWFSSIAGLTRSPGEALKLFKLYDPALSENIHALLADKKGNIWINNKHSVNSYSMNGQYPPRTIKLEGLDEKTEINSLYEDANNNIWIGTMGNGVFILNPRNNEYRKMDDYPDFEKASILSISGRGNAVFISSLQGTLITELGNENKDIRKSIRLTFYDNFETGTNYIYSIFRDSKGRTWFATDGKGLTMLEKGMFSYYNGTGKISDDHVYSITEDKKGFIWFSTGDAGVYKMDGKNFINYGLNEGLSDLDISALRTDSAGNIIIVNKKGFDILNPLTGNISYVNSNMGIGQVNAEDLGAFTQDSAGNVLVSSSLGVISFSSASALQKPTTVLESVQLFLKDLEENAPNHFSYDENNFTFNYTGLYYTSPDQVYYRYKLEGFDSAWVITKDRSKTFAQLEPRKYIFRIQSALNKSFRNADEASYIFIIESPFYKTYWFIIGAVLLFIFFVYWYVRTREKRLKKMQRLNQEKIQFRFEVLRNQVNPHFLFNSFNTLISAIEEDPKMAVEYVEQLSDFFRNIVNYRDTDVITLKEEIHLLETYAFLQQRRYGNNLQLDIRLNDEDKIHNFIPPLTLQLLIENAIKHNVVSKEMKLTIIVEIIDEKLIVLNNKNTRLSVQAGAGMGLQNIISRFRLLSNKDVIIIDDKTYFKVELPLIKKMS